MAYPGGGSDPLAWAAGHGHAGMTDGRSGGPSGSGGGGGFGSLDRHDSLPSLAGAMDSFENLLPDPPRSSGSGGLDFFDTLPMQGPVALDSLMYTDVKPALPGASAPLSTGTAASVHSSASSPALYPSNPSNPSNPSPAVSIAPREYYGARAAPHAATHVSSGVIGGSMGGAIGGSIGGALPAVSITAAPAAHPHVAPGAGDAEIPGKPTDPYMNYSWPSTASTGPSGIVHAPIGHSSASSIMYMPRPAGRAGKDGPDDVRKRERLEKNKESARQSRRRKKERLQELESNVTKLEAQKLALQAEVMALRAAEKQEEDAKKRKVQKRIKELVSGGGSEEDVKAAILDYRETYSDYGKERRAAVQYHLNMLESLLKPTQVTRMCLWSLHQDDDFYSKSGDGLWGLLCRELEVSDDQQKEIVKQRHRIRKLSAELNGALKTLGSLREQATAKNMDLERAMDDLQAILNPRQQAKFVVWVHENPVCMQMLNNMWTAIPK